MRAPAADEIVGLWERGAQRRPIDRSVLLGSWARPDVPPEQVADLPLGALNAALLRMRTASFGRRIDAFIACEDCDERLEVHLDATDLLIDVPRDEGRLEFEAGGLRFRAPTSRDLAAVASEADAEVGARRLLSRCCIDGAPSESALEAVLPEVERALEQLDPIAEIGLAVKCVSCGHCWDATFDVGSLLWDEIDACARRLLHDVHAIARAYGWSESEILALSPARRAAYLAMVDA